MGAVRKLFQSVSVALIGAALSVVGEDQPGQHVRPGEDIQAAIETAATNPTNKTVWIHEGTYRPAKPGPALFWLNRNHNGVQVRAMGKVTLTAANPDLRSKEDAGYPAVVNHVIYLGDGITKETLVEGFHITGANHFVTRDGFEELEPSDSFPKGQFFFEDGGAIKIFGRSFPTLRNLVIHDNYASPCAGGVSVEHAGTGSGKEPGVRIENCVFRNNRAQITGAAVDLLPGSSAMLINCLFVGNVANLGPDTITPAGAGEPFSNCGALTVFQDSRALVQKCTFAGNRNGADDMGTQSYYVNCLFWDNSLKEGMAGDRYDLDVLGYARVQGCWFGGKVIVSPNALGPGNRQNAPDPQFNQDFIPQNPAYEGIGYR